MVNSVVNIPISQASTPPGLGPPEPLTNGAVGVFTASQAAITFAGAPAVVFLIGTVLGNVFPSLADSKPLTLGLALGVGIIIYWQSVTGQSSSDKVRGFLFALINSFAVAGTILGIDTVL